MTHPVEMLLVQDDNEAVQATRSAFRTGKLWNHLHVVATVEAAVTFLNQEDEFTGSPRPDLVFLDADLPDGGACRLLRTIRETERFAGLRVVWLEEATGPHRAPPSGYQADLYVAKPLDVSRLLTITETLDGFGLQLVRMEAGS